MSMFYLFISCNAYFRSKLFSFVLVLCILHVYMRICPWMMADRHMWAVVFIFAISKYQMSLNIQLVPTVVCWFWCFLLFLFPIFFLSFSCAFQRYQWFRFNAIDKYVRVKKNQNDDDTVDLHYVAQSSWISINRCLK